MIQKLLNLNYKHLDEFQNEKLRKNFSIIINQKPKLPNTDYLIKIIEQKINYNFDNGTSFINRISLSIFFLYDTTNNQIIDSFCTPSYPFEIKTGTDVEVLQNLCDIYINDVKEIISDEETQEDTIYSA